MVGSVLERLCCSRGGRRKQMPRARIALDVCLMFVLIETPGILPSRFHSNSPSSGVR